MRLEGRVDAARVAAASEHGADVVVAVKHGTAALAVRRVAGVLQDVVAGVDVGEGGLGALCCPHAALALVRWVPCMIYKIRNRAVPGYVIVFHLRHGV